VRDTWHERVGLRLPEPERARVAHAVDPLVPFPEGGRARRLDQDGGGERILEGLGAGDQDGSRCDGGEGRGDGEGAHLDEGGRGHAPPDQKTDIAREFRA